MESINGPVWPQKISVSVWSVMECQERVWKVLGRCLESIRKVSGMYRWARMALMIFASVRNVVGCQEGVL